jgi:hypothetical protein
MNWKRLFVASVVIFIVLEAIDFVVDSVLLKSAYESLKSLWRPDMASRMWVLYIVGLLISFLFTYIFIKGREGKGIAEGVRFGIIIWLFVSVPMDLSLWVIFPIPHKLVLDWILFSLFEMLVAGILAAAIYKPLAPAKANPTA